MKPRSDSVLFKLTAPQQAQLYEWITTLGYKKARDRAALPPPEGFGVKTHLNSLHRFVLRYSDLIKEREFMDILRNAGNDPDQPFTHATENYAQYLAFQLATSPDACANFGRLARWIGGMKQDQYRGARLELARQRLELDDRKARLAAAKAAAAAPQGSPEPLGE